MPVVKRLHNERFFPNAALTPGDEVIAINGRPLRDVIDAQFYAADEEFALTIRRPDGTEFTLSIVKDTDADLGIEWEPDQIRICKANCDFCFVRQQPKKKLRRTLYIKDDDYRLSFLHGNFVTLTNMTEEDYQRIFEQRLTPLYVSVHCTDDPVRRILLRKANAQPIIPLLKRLHKQGIRTHTQIVVTPGMNDGPVLWKSFDDLLGLYPHVVSVGVVPIGLTAHRDDLPNLELVSATSAKEIIWQIGRRHAAMRERHGEGIIYAADEMFLIAGHSIPARDYYDDFSQAGNGIGMLRQLLDDYDARADDLPQSIERPLRLCVITGHSAGPFITDLCARTTARVKCLELIPLVVENDFWGRTVTVSGLLAASDMATQFAQSRLKVDAIIIPPECLNPDGLFLDDETVESLSSKIGMPVIPSEYDFVETVLNCTKSAPA
jgi:putative radical SAM enzyme (TIGR03279 family)